MCVSRRSADAGAPPGSLFTGASGARPTLHSVNPDARDKRCLAVIRCLHTRAFAGPLWAGAWRVRADRGWLGQSLSIFGPAIT
jgi:hypothetical protein